MRYNLLICFSCILGLFFGPHTLVAQNSPTESPALSSSISPTNSPAIERAISYLELEKAGRLALSEPDVKRRLYYQCRILFIHYLVTEDPDLLPHFMALSKTTAQALDKLPDDDPDKRVLTAEVFFLRGAAKALNKRYVGSAFDIKSACHLISRNLKEFPDHPEQFKLLGIFHVAMSTIPRKMQWLGKVLCFKGDLEGGLSELEAATQPGLRLPNEAQILLFYFEKNLLDRADLANARIHRLLEQYPDSRLYNYLLLSSYLELRQNDSALELAERMEPVLSANPDATVLPLWHYARARAHFCKLEYAACIRQLDIFLSAYKGKTLYADALYRKGMALVLSD
ncbi:MAG: hypothetical protein AAF570_27605, partial [Bacteroidota bacterium]